MGEALQRFVFDKPYSFLSACAGTNELYKNCARIVIKDRHAPPREGEGDKAEEESSGKEDQGLADSIVQYAGWRKKGRKRAGPRRVWDVCASAPDPIDPVCVRQRHAPGGREARNLTGVTVTQKYLYRLQSHKHISPVSKYLFDSAKAGAPPLLSSIYSESVELEPRGAGPAERPASSEFRQSDP